MTERDVIEAVRDFLRADESVEVAIRHADKTARRSANERRAVALGHLREVMAAYDRLSAPSVASGYRAG